MMSPTVSRAEMNASDDIIREVGVVPARRSANASAKAVGTPTSGCDGKVAFLNKAAADQSAKRHRGRVSYRCKFCRHWHVGGVLNK